MHVHLGVSLSFDGDDCGGGAEGAPEPQIRETLGVVREMPAGAP